MKKIRNELTLFMSDKENRIKVVKKVLNINTFLFVMLLIVTPAFAIPSNTSVLDPFVDFIATWVQRIGLVVAFVGGITWCFGFINNQMDTKSNGLMIIAGGFMLTALGSAPEIFGL